MFISGAKILQMLKQKTQMPFVPDQVQPNGIDLRFKNAYKLVNRKKNSGSYEPVIGEESLPLAKLEPGYYLVEFEETITIAEGHVGIVFPRSSLIRKGAMLFSAIWEPGYSGAGKCGLLVFPVASGSPLEVEQGERIAQLVIATADKWKQYNGQYQGEQPICVSRNRK